MTFYAEMAETANELIQEFGASATIRRILTDSSTYDAATGTTTPPAEVQTACTAVEIELDKKMIDGTMVRQSDSRLFVAVKGVSTPPVVGDLIVWGTVTYTVILAKPISPARTDVVYDLYIRAA